MEIYAMALIVLHGMMVGTALVEGKPTSISSAFLATLIYAPVLFRAAGLL